MITEQEKEIVEAGKAAGKSKQDILNAVTKYRQSAGITPEAPAAPEKKSFLQDAGEDWKDIGEDAIEEFDAAGKKIVAHATDPKKTILEKTLAIGSEAYKRGGRFIGKTLLNMGKIALPQDVEDKLKEAAVVTGEGVVKYTQDFYKKMQESEDPEERKMADQIGGLIDKYKTDEAFREQVDNAGGFLEGAAELIGGGAAVEGGKQAVKQSVKAAAEATATARVLSKEFDIPHFREGEQAVAEAIARIKNSKGADKADIQASQETINNFKQELKNQVTVNVSAGTDVSAITARLDQLIEQGKIKEAVQEAATATKKPGLVTSFSEGVLDSAVIAAQKIGQITRNVKDNATQRMAENLDRQALRENATIPIEQVDVNIGNMYKNAVSPGVKGKKQTLQALEGNTKAAVSAIKDMVTDKPNLTFRDVETNSLLKGELPSNLWEFGGAITSEKSNVWKQILEKIKASGEAPVDLDRVSVAMDEIIENPVYAGETAILNRAQAIKEKFDLNEYTPAQLEELIQLENDRLQAYYRGSGTQADAIVSAIVANNLRDILDETVEAATGAGIKELKAKYGNLKAIERDVVHRALHNDQARKAGMVDMFNVRSIGDVAAAASGNPVALARSAAQLAGESFIKAVNDRDDAIRRMFMVADERYSNTPSSEGN